jgi:hypothetical protein
MRPANFPTLRLAQFVALYVVKQNLFSEVLAIRTMKAAKELFTTKVNPYWQRHYAFGKVRTTSLKGELSDDSLYNLIINTVAPTLFAYGKAKENDGYTSAALSLLEETPPELNRITKAWTKLSLSNPDALASQGLLHLYKSYCEEKKCLSCAIGQKALQPCRDFGLKVVKSN